MKRSLLIVLSYLALLQFVAPLLVMIPYAVMQLIETGTTDSETLMQQTAIPAHLFTGLVVIAVSVGYAFHKKEERQFCTFSSIGVLLSSLVAMAAMVLLLEPLLSFLQLSDQSEAVFDRLLNNWVGIVAVAVVGPIAEELVFRKQVMNALEPHYTPAVRILFSALLFGLIHINPAQVIPAFILGFLLAWVYYRTGSILVTSLMHIANNSVSVVMISAYGNEVEILPATLHWGVRLSAYAAVCLLLLAALGYIHKSTKNVHS